MLCAALQAPPYPNGRFHYMIIVLYSQWTSKVQEKVASQFCPDYNQWVEPEKEMWLRRIMDKCRKGDYSNHAEFHTDVCQIAANSRAYNSEGHGIYRGPGEWF